MTGAIKIEDEGISGDVIRHTLNFIWVVDESASMSGAKIQAVNFAIRSVLPEIQKIEDTERVNIVMRAIRFGDTASWHIGPTPMPISAFVWRDMDAQGRSTSTAKAIDMLAQELTLEKLGRKNVPPVIILLSDGYCTDGPLYEQAISTLDNLPWGARAVRISIGIEGADERYDKAQLDRFISPYLRKEKNLETLVARNVRALVEHIRTASTVAAAASATSSTNLQGQVTVPVEIDLAGLQPSSGPTTFDYGTLDPTKPF